MIGCKEQTEYFQKAIMGGRLSHSYLFDGPDGVGKRTFALKLAQTLLCQNQQNGEPCGECKNCKLTEANNHPDITMIQPEGTTIKVDTIREKVVRELNIKPYAADRKIIIINEADCIGEAGQNAILKSIEEPIGHAVIILIAQNSSKLLGTILSRCIHIRFTNNTPQEINEYLETKEIDDNKKRLFATLSNGSIGNIDQMIENEVFLELRKDSIEYLLTLLKSDLVGALDLSQLISKEDRTVSQQVIAFWKLIVRDLLMIHRKAKVTLCFEDFRNELEELLVKIPLDKIKTLTELLDAAEKQIKMNIKVSYVLDSLFIKINKTLK